ncbi:MAG: choice-of-anchor D domain-containing protein [Chlorobi bacterium CHB2]|nr:choice-of-anchor D domain-containing protein [Chlorobi bacterium CHB2]
MPILFKHPPFHPFRRLLLWTGILLVALLAIPWPAASQSLLTLGDVDTAAFPNLTAPFFLTDSAGTPLSGVAATDITLTENGEPRTVTAIDCPPRIPPRDLSSVLAIDVSGSMTYGAPGIAIARSAAEAWVELLPLGASECAITSFDQNAYLNQDFTTARWKLLEAIDQLRPQGGTSYDTALLATPLGALNIAARGQHRRVVVLLTDGQSDVDEGMVIARANAVGASIYCVTIGLDAPDPLKRIAAQTGGFCIQNVNSQDQARAAYRLILGHARFGGVCTIRWRSGPACDRQRDLQVSVPKLNASGGASYRAPATAIIRAVAIPTGILFPPIPPGQFRDTTIELVAGDAPITVSDIAIGDPRFSVVSGGAPPSFTIPAGQRRTITLRYRPTDSLQTFASVRVDATPCGGTSIFLSAGFPGRNPAQPSIRVVLPNGGEKLVVNDSVVLEWEGVLPDQRVRLEFSTDAGTTWNRITDSGLGLRHGWRVPDAPSDQCLLRATALSRDTVVALLGHQRAVVRAVFSPNGERAATAGLDSTVRVWDSYTGAELMRLQHPAPVRSVAFSPNGALLLSTATDGKGRLWNANSGQLIRELFVPARPFGDGTFAGFSPDGALAVTSGIGAKPDHDAEVWDVATGALIRTLAGHTNYVTHAAFSPDGGRIATSGGYDRTVRVWDRFTGAEILRIGGFTAIVHTVEWSPDGTTLITASTNVQTWDAATGAALGQFAEGGFSASSNPAGTQVAISTFGPAANGGYVTLWDQATRQLVGAFGEPGVLSLGSGFNQNGYRIISADQDSVARIWNIAPEPVQSDQSDSLWSIVRAAPLLPAIDLGKVTVGSRRDSVLTAWLCNRSSATIRVDSITLAGGDVAEFAVVSVRLPLTLLPGECQQIEFRFAPQVVGNRGTGVQILGNFGSASSQLRGQGVLPALSVNGGLVDFGKIRLGTSRDSVATVTLSNSTPTPVRLTSVLLLGPDTRQFQALDSAASPTLSPGQSYSIPLRFRPVLLGLTNAQVRVLYSGAGGKDSGVVIIPLVGEGICADVAATATVALPDTIGVKAGEISTFPIVLRNASNVVESGVRGFTITLRCNASVLLPLDSGVTSVVANGQRIITVRGSWSGGSDTLFLLNMVAGLGDSEWSRLAIDSLQWDIECPVQMGFQNGEVQLLDLCNSGGVTRLFNPDAQLVLRPVFPNPAGDQATIEFSLAEPGRTALTIWSSASAQQTKTIFDRPMHAGRHVVVIPTEDLPAGIYFYKLETPTAQLTRKFVVKR